MPLETRFGADLKAELTQRWRWGIAEAGTLMKAVDGTDSFGIGTRQSQTDLRKAGK